MKPPSMPGVSPKQERRAKGIHASDLQLDNVSSNDRDHDDPPGVLVRP